MTTEELAKKYNGHPSDWISTGWELIRLVLGGMDAGTLLKNLGVTKETLAKEILRVEYTEYYEGANEILNKTYRVSYEISSKEKPTVPISATNIIIKEV